MSRWDSKFVKCPYFHKFETNRICCEGVADKNTINVVFESPGRLKEYTKTYCYQIKDCHQCLVCKMLDDKNGGACY
jgi:hypothetical protein